VPADMPAGDPPSLERAEQTTAAPTPTGRVALLEQ